MALEGILSKKDYHVYVLIGDGESDEGEIWEVVMSASKYELHNLTTICDFNRIQLDGPTDTIMSLDPLLKKWESFN